MLGTAGSLAGAIANWREAQAERRRLEKAERDNQLWYDRRYNEVGRESDGMRGLITKMREAQKARTDRAVGSDAVMGAASARVASEQQAANKAMGDVIGQADAAQAARRRAIEKEYLSRKDNIRGARSRLSAAQQQSVANAVGQASAIGANMIANGIGDGKVKSDGEVGAASADNATVSSAPVVSGTTLSYSNSPYYGKTTADNLSDYWRKQLNNIYGTVWNQ